MASMTYCRLIQCPTVQSSICCTTGCGDTRPAFVHSRSQLEHVACMQRASRWWTKVPRCNSTSFGRVAHMCCNTPTRNAWCTTIPTFHSKLLVTVFIVPRVIRTKNTHGQRHMVWRPIRVRCATRTWVERCFHVDTGYVYRARELCCFMH